MQHRYRVFLVCAIGVFTSTFDASASVVALPTIALQFGTDLPTAQWVVVGNGLTIAALLVPMGRLSDLIGRKSIYVVGCLLFASGALLASLSDTVFALIGSRIVVGVGSAMTQATAMAILVSNFDAAERARLLGFQLGGVGLGAILGPAAGGLIVATIGWRMLYALTAIAILAIGIAAQRVLRKRVRRPEGAQAVFDMGGAALFSSLLVAGLLTLTLGPRLGWAHPAPLTGAAIFCVLLAAFIVVERRHPLPMLDFRLFRRADFALGALAALVLFMGVSATRFLAPFFFQSVKGFDPARVGLLMMPAAIVIAIGAPLIGRFADNFGVRRSANIGFFVVIVGLMTFALVEASSPTWLVVVGLMISALGVAAFSASNSAAILNSVDRNAHGVAAGFVNLCRNTGNVIGIAFGTAMVTLTMAREGFPPTLDAIDAESGRGVLVAFARGISSAAVALIVLFALVLGILIVWTLRAQAGRQP